MIYEKLTRIQNKLKAPKSKYNSFGKYNYRSLEDILEAVKPLLLEEKVALFIEDNVVQVGERYYVKASAFLYDSEDKSIVTSSAFAREEDEKKGMDGSQITGTASSYARKYCLNGLFCIDDTKDADTDEYRNEIDKKSKTEKAKEDFKASATKPEFEGVAKASDLPSQDETNKFKALCKAKGIEYSDVIKSVGWKKGEPFTSKHLASCYEEIRKRDNN